MTSPLAEGAPPPRVGSLRRRVGRAVERLVDGASEHPWRAVMVAIALIGLAVLYSATTLELRPDLLELLPQDSPAFRAFNAQAHRLGGGASLLVIVRSPDPGANERFIDALSAALDDGVRRRKECLAACGSSTVGACESRCGRELIGYIESETKEVRAFYRANRWLYATLADLEDADSTLDRQIAIRAGLVADLEDPPPRSAGGPRSALGMDSFRDRWEAAAKRRDDFPTGYFCSHDRSMCGLRVVSTTQGMGDALGDRLLQEVQATVESLGPRRFHPDMQWGYAGDIANAHEEKQSLVSRAYVATMVAGAFILAGIAVYFRSLSALVVIALPALFGVAMAYAFATFAFGYVNTAGLFLGAIILGNGINYPIVLLSRYREFHALGMPGGVARREAVKNAFRAELVGACVAAIAYGALAVTQFRGFRQFGIIGSVGMLVVWLAIVPLVPALVVLLERLQARLPRGRAWQALAPAADGSSGPVMRALAQATERAPWLFVLVAGAAVAFFGVRAASFLKDPWEYDFSRLGSRETKAHGAGYWSNQAEAVFGGRINVAGVRIVADSVEQVPALKAQILANDARDPAGTLLENVVTVWDMLPGSPSEQRAKLAVLARIRDRLTPRVLLDVTPNERLELEDLRPPEGLDVLYPTDLPLLVKRRFTERDGRLGAVMYLQLKDVILSDGHNALRISHTTDNVHLPDGTVVQTASHSTIYAEMIRSIKRDGPVASAVALSLVLVVVALATSNLEGAVVVLAALLTGVISMLGIASIFDLRLHYISFIAIPITLGIGCEYPFNVFDRVRLLSGDVSAAVRRTGGAVALCSYTTIVGYGSLLMSDFQALETFGRLAVVGEVACSFGALLLVPSLLQLRRARRLHSL